MAELAHLDPEEGVRALILKWAADDIGIRGLPDDASNHVGRWLETGLAAAAPYVSVDLIGGPQTYFDAHPVLQIDWFSDVSTADVKSMAADTTLRFLQYPDSVAIGDRTFLVDSASVIQQPLKTEWEDENIRRMSARFELSVRR